ncbi:CRTAC1 family protein [Portibacter marinus]|uniref:CRTAC1 family protein n=1 Tax=Portibacter marinus TaxID=2898660 RepID=UPI001F39D9AE|nr:CRTAC1 family protein [Portibacter marinus]
MKLHLFVMVIFVFLSCTKERPNPNQSAIDRLKNLYQNTKTDANHPYQNELKADLLAEQLHDLPSNIPVQLRYETAYEYLKAGENEKAIDVIKDIIITDITNRNYEYFRLGALAYLRKAEQENCFHQSGKNACTLPFTESTIHTNKRSGQRSVELLLQMLKFKPNDVESKWLLNIAARAIGSVEMIPQEHYINLNLSENSEIEFVNTFQDASMGHAGGSSMEDFDNDGDLDLFVTSYHLNDNVRYYVNENGTFKDHTKKAFLNGITGGLNLIHGDVNGDGFQDILILRGGWLESFGNLPPSLLINQGDHTFIDRTEEWGILVYQPTQTAAFSDFNNDGQLDLILGSERKSVRLYENTGAHFRQVEQSGINCKGFVKGISVGDVNNDGLSDIYISVLGDENQLYLNKDNFQFEDKTEIFGVASPINSFVTWFFDYNNDGWEDLFVGGYNIDNKRRMIDESIKDFMGDTVAFSHPRLYRNEGGSKFTDVTNEVGLNKELFAMGGNYGDVNNDGYLDIYLGTGEFNMWAIMPNRLFINQNGEYFTDETFNSGLGMIQKGHGISFGDFDNDGDQDIFHTIGGAVQGDVFMNYLYENKSTPRNWITLSGLLPGSRVSVYTPGFSVQRTVSTGGSFGNNSLWLEIGLGTATKIDSINISDCTFVDLQVNSKYKVNKQICEIEKLQ